MNEQGLAAQASGGLGQQIGMGRGQRQQLIMEVVKLLQQGATPEQLMEAGVPKEIIDAALNVINSATSTKPQIAEQPQQGLAASLGGA